MRDLSQTYFELFQMPAAFAVDIKLLDQRYRQLQSEVHPDRFASATAAERMQSMQWATFANEAYQTLKSPAARARYLLKLADVDTEEESNTAMPPDFLMLQMEWREIAEEAKAEKNIAALEQLASEMKTAARDLQATLQITLDDQQDLKTAAEAVRKLSFIDKISADVSRSIDALEDQIH